MANRKIELACKYHTAPQIQRQLNLNRSQLTLRIIRGILPAPTFIDTTGVRYFDEQWLRTARAILANVVNPQQASPEPQGREFAPRVVVEH